MLPRCIGGERGSRSPRVLVAVLAGFAALLFAPQAFAVAITIAPEAVGAGTPVTDFRYLINVDNTGDPSDPDPMQHPGFKPMASSSPTVALGDETEPVADLEPGRYLVSISADGYKFWGRPFTVEAGTPQTVVVELLPTPLPLGKLQVSVFQDNRSVNAAPDVPEIAGNPESGLAGFRIVLEDNVGEVSVDYYNNPLCTRYFKDAAGTFIDQNGDGEIPDPIPGTGGDCLTDVEGNVTIEQLPPDRYHIIAIPPDGAGWIHTTTFEGKPEIDWARVTEGDDGFGAIGERLVEPLTLPTAYWFGFVKQCTFGSTTDACPANDVAGDKTITGRARTWVGWPPFDNLVFGQVVSQPWVALTNLGGAVFGDEVQVYTARGNADGTFTIPNIPAGSYQLAIWDNPLDHIIRFLTVNVAPGDTAIDLGDVGVARWFGWISGHVFEDTGLTAAGLAIPGAADNGIRDCAPANPADCEVGIPQSDLDIRYRDGSVKSATFTNPEGSYAFNEEVSKLFKFGILEVGFGRFARTGHSYYNELRVNHPEGDHDSDGTPNGTDPDFADPIVVPQDLGGGLLLNQLTMESHRSVVDFGKREYVADNEATPEYEGENGGIAGIVFHGTTRNELDARLQANEDYEPGIGGVTMRLWGLGADGEANTADDVLLNELITDEWSHPRSDHPDLPQSCDVRNADGVLAGSLPSFPASDPDVSPNCTEVGLLSNETKAGAFDGGFQFESSCNTGGILAGGDVDGDGVPNDEDPDLFFSDSWTCSTVLAPGDYVVQALVPEHFQNVKEEDVNVNDGAAFVPAIVPVPCAGDLHVVDVAGVPPDGANAVFNPTFAESTLYDPDGGSPFEEQEKPLCDKKLVTLQDQQNPEANFFFFTGNGMELPGRVFGLVSDDIYFETDPRNVWYGEARGLPDIPIGVRDFTGRLITTLLTDEYGFYEVLLPSTDTANCPNPAGICPGTYVFVVNDPGDPDNPNPTFNPNYLTEPVAFDVWPGTMTPADTPLDPIAGVTCAPRGIEPFVPEPEFFSVSQPYGSSGAEITIRGTDFGDTQGTGTVTLDGVAQTVSSWTDDTITATLTGDPGAHQLLVSSGSGKTSRSGITFHILGTGYDPPIVTVDDDGPADFTTIQAAIDAAAAGSLVVVGFGTYRENVIMHKRIKLQGHGPGGLLGTRIQDFRPDDPRVHVPGSVIDGRFFRFPANQTAWEATLAGPASPYDSPPGSTSVPEGAALTVVAADGEFTDGFNAQIDGLGMTLGRAFGAGGIQVHAFARNLAVTNNFLEGNGGEYGGALSLGSALVGDNQNDNVVIRHNRVMGNGGRHLAGGIGIFNGAEEYLVQRNELCANFSGEYGGALSHYGFSPGGRIVENFVYMNDAFDEGGGILVGGEEPTGGAPLTQGSGPVDIERNIIHSNVSQDDGGGIKLLDPLTYRVNIVNNMLINNAAADFGGGISLDNASNVTIVNNTVAYNFSTGTSEDRDVSCGENAPFFSCPHSAGIMSELNEAAFQATLPPGSPNFSDPTLFNNILWGNEAFTWNPNAVPDPTDPDATPAGVLESQGCIDLEVFGTPTPQFLSPRFSILSVPYPDAGTTHPSNIVGADCTDSDFPQFVTVNEVALEVAPNRSNPAEILVTMVRDNPQPLGHDGLPGDYHLAIGSPAINAGTDSFGDVGAPFDDIDLELRPQDAAWEIGADETPGVPPEPLDPEVPPEIEGDEGEVLPGATLTATTGSWTGTPPITFAFQWQRDANPSWLNIPGATTRAYEVRPADVGHRLRVVVTAANLGGLYSATAESAPTPVVSAPAAPPPLPPPPPPAPSPPPPAPSPPPAGPKPTAPRAAPRKPQITNRSASALGQGTVFRATTTRCTRCSVFLRIRFDARWHAYRMSRVASSIRLSGSLTDRMKQLFSDVGADEPVTDLARTDRKRWIRVVRDLPTGRWQWDVRVVDLDTGLETRTRIRWVRVS